MIRRTSFDARSGPDDGRLVFDRFGRMWMVHDFQWWEFRRWLHWARVCVDGRSRYQTLTDGKTFRLERIDCESGRSKFRP